MVPPGERADWTPPGRGLCRRVCIDDQKKALDVADLEAIDAVKAVARRFVITLGAKGAVTWDGEKLHRVAAKPVEAVNTNGAGDMFAGAFLYALSRGESDLRATEFATLAAGEVVKYFGPRLDRDACLELRRQFFGD